MRPLMPSCRASLAAFALLAGAAPLPASQAEFVPGSRQIALADFSVPSGDGALPAQLRLVSGKITVAERDGARMLAAHERTILLLTLPEVLPAQFTLEFDLVPRDCICLPPDLMLETTMETNRGPGSVEVEWLKNGVAMIGGGPNQEVKAPEGQAESLQGTRVQVRVSVDGTRFRLFTNETEIVSQERRFVRSRYVRITLGGNGEEEGNAVYLARVRVAAGGGTAAPVVVTTMTPATATGMVMPAPPPPTAPPPPPPPATSAAPASAMPPIGVAAPAAAEPPQEAGARSIMRLNGLAFDVTMRSGGAVAGQVVETTLADGTVKKSLSMLSYEPLVFDVAPGSPIDAWLKTDLDGGRGRQSGSLIGGVVPGGQQLEFRDAMLISVTIPGLDASNTAPGFLRVVLAPEEIRQAPLTGAMTAPGPSSWTRSDFRISMGDLETKRVVRVEPLSTSISLTTSNTGEQRVTQQVVGKRTLSNVRITLVEDAGAPATNWLAWYDDFVIKGNNGDDRERTFLLELGLGRTGSATARLRLRGSGVGIIAVRGVPPPPNTTIRMLQIDLYVERLEVNP